jgi:hypothetical protein
VAILTIGVGLNGAIYSGFKVNHLDISPRFAGILMSLTNCLANLAGLLAPIVAGYVIDKRVRPRVVHVFVCTSMHAYIFDLLSETVTIVIVWVYAPEMSTLQVLTRNNVCPLVHNYSETDP